MLLLLMVNMAEKNTLPVLLLLLYYAEGYIIYIVMVESLYIY